MDIFTNFLLSGVLSIGVWIIGIFILKRQNAADVSYVNWLKIWALTAGIQALIFSTLLSIAFPDPAEAGLLAMLFG